MSDVLGGGGSTKEKSLSLSPGALLGEVSSLHWGAVYRTHILSCGLNHDELLLVDLDLSSL